MQTPCNNYEIRCTSFEDPPLYSYWADYTDCYGVSRRQLVSIGGVWGPRTVNICSKTTPVPGDNMPGPFPAPVTVTLIGPCDSQGLPNTPCGQSNSYSGGQSFPSRYSVNLGPTTGTVTLSYDTVNIPDKIIIYYNGAKVVDTGYRGASSYQSQLNDALASRGLPPETIAGGAIGSTTFNKNASINSCQIEVWAPLESTAWQVTVSCPA